MKKHIKKDFYYWLELAKSYRKSYLGKPLKLSKDKERWIKPVLDMWGSEMRGSVYNGGNVSVIGRLMIRTEWDDKKASHILSIVERLYEKGLRGTELFAAARKEALMKIQIDQFLDFGCEVELVDHCFNKCFPSGPIREVAKAYYIENMSMLNIAKKLMRFCNYTITEKMARDRIRWCLEILHKSMYDAISYEIEAKIQHNANKMQK